jgi:hypothetical protein
MHAYVDVRAGLEHIANMLVQLPLPPGQVPVPFSEDTMGDVLAQSHQQLAAALTVGAAKMHAWCCYIILQKKGLSGGDRNTPSSKRRLHTSRPVPQRLRVVERWEGTKDHQLGVLQPNIMFVVHSRSLGGFTVTDARVHTLISLTCRVSLMQTPQHLCSWRCGLKLKPVWTYFGVQEHFFFSKGGAWEGHSSEQCINAAISPSVKQSYTSIRVVQIGVPSKIWVCKVSRILTNPKNAVCELLNVCNAWTLFKNFCQKFWVQICSPRCRKEP